MIYDEEMMIVEAPTFALTIKIHVDHVFGTSPIKPLAKEKTLANYQ